MGLHKYLCRSKTNNNLKFTPMTKSETDLYIAKQERIIIIMRRVRRNARRVAELGSCLTRTRTKGDPLYRDLKWAEHLKDRISQRSRMKSLLVDELMNIGI